MNRADIIEFLKNHKKVLAIYETVKNDYDAVISASSLSLVHVQTSGSNSQVEAALEKVNREIKYLEKEIKRVKIWLDYLDEEERFIVEEIYFKKRFLKSIANRWEFLGNEYRTTSFWKNKHRKALKKLVELSASSKIL